MPSAPSGFFAENALAPSGTGNCQFLISEGKIRHFLRYGPAHKFFEAMAIPAVLQNPLVIFRGLEREEMADGLCYAGLPEIKHLDHNITVPPPPGFTFAIFADAEYRVFEWRWEKADPDTNYYPTGWQTRFTKIQWYR
jgi:hypothetical protein